MRANTPIMKHLRSAFIVYLACLVSAFAADPPTENQGANALAATIRGQSNGLLRLVTFTKTNGQKSLVNGIELYTMETAVEVEANQDCALTGFMVGGGWDGSFGALKAKKPGNPIDAFNPSGASYGSNKQVARGTRLKFNVDLRFDLTERGWRTGGTLPADVPFQPDALPESVPEKPKQKEPAWERPGTKEAAAVEIANKEIDGVYQKLMSTLDPGKQKRLREAQRAWLKDRDGEAERIARDGGAVGGSALRVDILTAQEKLIRQRTEILKGYLQNPNDIP